MSFDQTSNQRSSIQQQFLDWSRPALESVAEQLLLRSRSETYIDLSHLILVFYGRQAGRRCLEILTEQAGGSLCPPRIVTVGQLPELLYTPQRPFASKLVQQLVWAQALKNLPAEKLQLFVRVPPDPAAQPGWMRLGELLRKLHEELARDQLNFTDVWQTGASLEGFNETARWQLLAEIQQEYWRLLDGFELWDQQTARLEAIKRKECRTDKEIVTVGTVDLNRTMRSMLDQVSDRVTTYIHSSPDWADGFDAHGCLVPTRWADRQLDLSDDQIFMADDSADQCSTILSLLAGFDGKYAIEDITIGVPDQRLVRTLQRTLNTYGVASHWPVDRILSSTGPYRVLEAVADWLEDPTAQNFAALIRHPDVSLWLSAKGLPENWLTDWDLYFNEHLPRKMDRIQEGYHSSSVRRLKKSIDELLSKLPSKFARLAASAEPVAALLQTLYGQQSFAAHDPQGRQLLDVCETLKKAFAEHVSVPEELDCPLSVAEAIRLTLNNANGELYRGESDPALQLVGWLEMPLDDAPVAIVTTFNESFVPTSVNHDLFLPNRLRAHLGIEDNARRYARDLYVLSTLVHSREQLRLIVARRDDAKDPLAPSRLLFATEPKKIAQRVLAFYDSQTSVPRLLPASPLQIGTESNFPIPRPLPYELESKVFRVTEFRDYLASPYRYYLRHVLRLSELNDDVDELGGAAFGNLIHNVLKAFGQSACSESADPAAIESFLHSELQYALSGLYGESPLAAIILQSEQAKRRLTAFAHWQANWRDSGWEIFSVERGTQEPVLFPLDEERSIQIKGRIDRIDFHPSTGRWAIFDYKTGDAGASPERTHRYKEEWTDLQLPLYRHLAAQVGVRGDVQLGYIVLPRDTNSVQALFAEWSEQELEDADGAARVVAQRILKQEFWQTLSEPGWSLLEYDPICQAGVFGQEALL